MQAMVKPGQQGYRMAYSARDVDYLERMGWVKFNPAPVSSERRPTLTLPKRGRPKVDK